MCKESLSDIAEKKKQFCLQRTQSGSLQLLRSHQYYMQCQLQMHVTRRSYCDFVVWHDIKLSENDDQDEGTWC